MKIPHNSIGWLSNGGRIVAVLTVILALLCWLSGRRESRTQRAYAALRTQVGLMQEDVAAIEQLRQAPQIATERVRPNDELLDEIRSAMTESGLSEEHWLASDPSPPIRIPSSPYKQLDTRLTFDAVSIRELVGVSYRLVAMNPALSIRELRLTAPRSDNHNVWKAELSVSYLTYAPY